MKTNQKLLLKTRECFNYKIIIFFFVFNFAHAQSLLQDMYGEIKVVVVYPKYAEAEVNEQKIKIIRKNANTDIISFPKDVFFSYDNSFVWYNSKLINVSPLDKDKNHLITVYWDYGSNSQEECEWSNYLRKSIKNFKKKNASENDQKEIIYAGWPKYKEDWLEIITNNMTKNNCGLEIEDKNYDENELVKTKTISLQRTKEGISERFTIETNAGITAFFANQNNIQYVTGYKMDGYADVMRISKQDAELSKLENKNLQDIGSGKEAKTSDEISAEINQKKQYQENENESQRERKEEINNNIEQKQKEFATDVSSVVGVAVLGLQTNNKNNIYFNNSNTFGLGLGLSYESFPMPVYNESTFYNNGQLISEENNVQIETEETVGFLMEIKYAPHISKLYQPKFTVTGGYNIAVAELIKTSSDGTFVASNGDTSDSYNETYNHSTYYKVNLKNYLGKNKTKFIVALEYADKTIDYYKVTNYISTSGLDTSKSIDSSYVKGSIANYNLGLGVSFGSPNKLNCEILIEKCNYFKVFEDTHNIPFSNFRLSVNFWQASHFNLGLNISSYNKELNSSVNNENLFTDYKSKYMYQISLIYNKDWFWKH